MRKPRFTFQGALHHAFNRGHNKSNIFNAPEDKTFFINTMCKRAKLLKINIIAYCIMNNHYHIILENSSGKLSKFFQQLNSIYAMYYRKKYGGCGAVFQGRFKSTLIEHNNYLEKVIVYVLLNPIRKKDIKNPFDYKWSSINKHFTKNTNTTIKQDYIKTIFGNINNFKFSLENLDKNWLTNNIKKCKYGTIIGSQKYITQAEKHYQKYKNISENNFKSISEIVNNFEINEGIKLNEMTFNTLPEKKLRIKLLVELRLYSGLTFREIYEKIEIFHSLKITSLNQLFKLGTIQNKSLYEEFI